MPKSVESESSLKMSQVSKSKPQAKSLREKIDNLQPKAFKEDIESSESSDKPKFRSKALSTNPEKIENLQQKEESNLKYRDDKDFIFDDPHLLNQLHGELNSSVSDSMPHHVCQSPISN